jgi:protein-S-isoprenylcysteine O-methyltransferase Ste14
MTKTTAGIGSLLFLFAAPGTVTGIVPWWLTGLRAARPLDEVLPVRVLGALLLAVGAALLLASFARFVMEGVGTPLPLAPPQHLVVGGAYRHVRNPMYVAIAAINLGEAAVLWQLALLVYAVCVWAVMASFVVLYEQPKLRRTYGEEYEGVLPRGTRVDPAPAPVAARRRRLTSRSMRLPRSAPTTSSRAGGGSPSPRAPGMRRRRRPTPSHRLAWQPHHPSGEHRGAANAGARAERCADADEPGVAPQEAAGRDDEDRRSDAHRGDDDAHRREELVGGPLLGGHPAPRAPAPPRCTRLWPRGGGRPRPRVATGAPKPLRADLAAAVGGPTRGLRLAEGRGPAGAVAPLQPEVKRRRGQGGAGHDGGQPGEELREHRRPSAEGTTEVHMRRGAPGGMKASPRRVSARPLSW